MKNTEYLKQSTQEVAVFVDGLKDNAKGNAGTFDSAAAADYMSEVTNRNTGITVPEKLQLVLDECDEKQSPAIIKAILDGVSIYESQHGCEVPADLIETAFHVAYSTTDHAARMYRGGRLSGAFDSANSSHHDQYSLQPNRAVLAILTMMGEAIPFAHYLPTDISSNEAILAIMSHIAGSTHGSYAANAIMDGASSGDAYISSSRVNVSFPAGGTGNITGALTRLQSDYQTCDPAAAQIKLLRGRTNVFVNGQFAAKENDTSGSGSSSVSGTIKIAGTTYAIGGTINTDTGVYALTSTPALPTTVPVAVEGFIDYERAPELTPSIITDVQTYRYYAAPWRVTTQQTIDSRTQMANELGLDSYSESVLAIQGQFANERHYNVLYKALRLAVNNQATFDFDWAARYQQMNRAQIWRDLFPIFGQVSQKMAVDTMDHGVSHMYTGRLGMSNFLGMPEDIFRPSGIRNRPGIFRVGRYMDAVDVYYTPKGITETSTSTQILCIGKANNVAMNPFVLGDAEAPTVIPLGVNADLKQGAGFYARNFTSVNKYAPASLSCALINVTDLY